MTQVPSRQLTAAVDDPAWVLDRYREARSLLDEIQTNVALPQDFCDEVQDFLDRTFFDTCTTLGNDCACNRRTA